MLFKDFETHFRKKIVLKLVLKYYEAPHTVSCLTIWGRCLMEFYLYENDFLNHEIFQQTISLFPRVIYFSVTLCSVQGRILASRLQGRTKSQFFQSKFHSSSETNS
jgi:hypothetical protein